MDDSLPSYESAITCDVWPIIAYYIHSSDLCSASLVCRRWHRLFAPLLWGDPASHFTTDSNAIYAITRFRMTLKYARLGVRTLTHTLYLPPAPSEIYGRPQPSWLKEILVYLPCLQSLMVSRHPFFDHNAMSALKCTDRYGQPELSSRTYSIRLLLAEDEPNATSYGIAETLLRFPELVYLDLSYTKPARDRSVLLALAQLTGLRVLKLRGIGLKDDGVELLANVIKTKVRFLDLRDNILTDLAVQYLLRASFLSPEQPSVAQVAEEATTNPWNVNSHPALASFAADFVRRPDLDKQLVKLLSRPITDQPWTEGLLCVGITHLYISGNCLTVKGVADLLASARLHALDTGTVHTVSGNEGPSAFGFENLIPILATSAKNDLTFVRTYHAVVTSDIRLVEYMSPGVLLPRLQYGESSSRSEVPSRAELDFTNGFNELSPEACPVIEDSDVPVAHSTKDHCSDEGLQQLIARGSGQAPQSKRGRIAASDAASSNIEDYVRSVRRPVNSDVADRESSLSDDRDGTGLANHISQSYSPVSWNDPRVQKIQELLAKRPKRLANPWLDRKYAGFPFLHPSDISHLEILILTDVPSHIPLNSPLLNNLIRFITACSNEAMLAILQSQIDYSLPPGRSRFRAEKQRARSLFALRRIVLEIKSTSQPDSRRNLRSWKQSENQDGASSIGDRDLDNMWSAATYDFSFFDDNEYGVPQNDSGKHFPMAALDEEVSLMPDDYEHNGAGPLAADTPPPVSIHSERQGQSCPGLDPFALELGITYGKNLGPSVGDTEIDVVAELSAFRRRKRIEYEERVQHDLVGRILTPFDLHLCPLNPTESSLSISNPNISTRATVPLLSMAHFVEGHWEGEIKIVRNSTPKNRSGMVNVYGS